MVRMVHARHDRRRLQWSRSSAPVKVEPNESRHDFLTPNPTNPAAAFLAASALASTANDVFVGMQKGAPLSPPAMAQVLARLGYDEIATPHGLRSSFRDWRAECSHFPFGPMPTSTQRFGLEKDALASVVYPVTSRIVVAEMVDVGRDR